MNVLHAIKHQSEWDQTKYEDRVVEFILKRFGLEQVAGELRARAKEEVGYGSLHLPFFHARFETFPMSLLARKSVDRPEYLSHWFGSFDSSQLVSSYYDVLDMHEGDVASGHVGMVFHAPYLKLPVNSLVIHNAPPDTTIAGHRFVSSGPDRTFVVEPLSTLLDSIARQWPEPQPAPPSKPQRKRKS